MAEQGKTKYQRDIERARAAGFSSPYAMRKARAKERGYSSPRAERTAREKARGKERDYAAERERANIRAQARGFRSARDQARFNREAKSNPAADRSKWQKERILKHFGITVRTLNKIRKENREWADEWGMLHYREINEYKTEIDGDVNNWSERRIGYILAFHAAIVNPKSNYSSLLKGGKREKNRDGTVKTNKSQYYYLVKYTNITQVDEFEARYGRQIVKDAEEGEVTP